MIAGICPVKMNQPPACASTIPERDIVPASITIVRIESPIESS